MADGVTVRVDGAKAAVRAFDAAPALLTRRLSVSVRSAGSLMRTRVRANASGRSGVTGPALYGGTGEIGPRVQTGDYRRSIGLATYSAGGQLVAEVGTNAPQGRRLEQGFIGADSLGRVYHQRPLPHFGPAVAPTEHALNAAIEADLAFVDRFVAGA